MKIAFRAVNEDALTPDDFVVRAQEEMDLVADASEFGAVKAPNGPAANNRDFHKTTE